MARQRGTTAFLLFRNPLRQLRQKVGYWPRFSIDVGRIRNDPFSLALSRLTLAVARPAAASRRRGGTAADGAEPVLQPDHPQEAHPPTRGVLQRVPGGAADQHVVFGHTAWRWSSTSAQPLPAQQNNTSCWRSCAWRRICAPGYAPGCPARRASPRWGLLRCARNDRQCGGGRALRHGDLPLGELAHGCLHLRGDPRKGAAACPQPPHCGPPASPMSRLEAARLVPSASPRFSAVLRANHLGLIGITRPYPSWARPVGLVSLQLSNAEDGGPLRAAETGFLGRDQSEDAFRQILEARLDSRFRRNDAPGPQHRPLWFSVIPGLAALPPEYGNNCH